MYTPVLFTHSSSAGCSSRFYLLTPESVLCLFQHVDDCLHDVKGHTTVEGLAQIKIALLSCTFVTAFRFVIQLWWGESDVLDSILFTTR